MKDRFSEAIMELNNKNPYICDTCEVTYGHPTIEHGHERHELSTKSVDCILNCDPVPFGD